MIMKSSLVSALLLLLNVVAPYHTTIDAANGQVLRGATATTPTPAADSIDCHLHIVAGTDMYDGAHLEKYQCLVSKSHENESQDDIDGYEMLSLVEVELPETFVSEHRRILAHTPVLRITGGVYDNSGVLVAPEKHKGRRGVVVTDKVSPHRRLAVMTGVKKVLAVRVVTTLGQEPSESFDELRGRIMGAGPRPEMHTVCSQMKACSMDALDIQPADSNDGTGIIDGVVQVTVNLRIDNSCNILGACQEEIRRQTEMQMEQRLQHFDFIMFCVPDGSTFGLTGSDSWAAFAYLGNNIQFYHRGLCGVLTTNMHETGHNLGFGHSSENNMIRGDLSGSMGSSLFRVGGPLQCWNGHKYSMGGWLWDHFRQADLTNDPTPWLGRIVAFTDHHSSNLQLVDSTLLRVVLPGAMDLYLVYNKAKSFNIGTREKPNLVTIVQADAGDSRDSTMLAGLNVGRSFSVGGLTVTVCGISEDEETDLDYAIVNVFRNELSSTCDEYNAVIPTPFSSSTPSLSPSEIPSSAPSSAPSKRPVSAPGNQVPFIINSPSRRPSPSPSKSPAADPATMAPTVREVQSSRPSDISFAGAEMQGMEQCTRLGSTCSTSGECCDSNSCYIPLRPFEWDGDKKCCLVAKTACMTNSDCCSGRCRWRNSQCF